MSDKETNMQHFMENVWLKRIMTQKKGQMQMVNICIRLDDDTFAGVGVIYFYNGVYYDSKNDSLGTIDDDSFLSYIEKLTGVNNRKGSTDTGERKLKSDISLEELYDEYRNTQSIKKTAKKAGLSEEKTKKLLISAGLYTSEKHEKIKALLDQGKTLDEISRELKISQKQLRIFIPNDKK